MVDLTRKTSNQRMLTCICSGNIQLIVICFRRERLTVLHKLSAQRWIFLFICVRVKSSLPFLTCFGFRYKWHEILLALLCFSTHPCTKLYIQWIEYEISEYNFVLEWKLNSKSNPIEKNIKKWIPALSWPKMLDNGLIVDKLISFPFVLVRRLLLKFYR